MAKRFGGAYSPDGASNSETAKRVSVQVDPAGSRATLLFLPPVVLAFFSLGNGAGGLLAGLAGAGTLAAGALFLREGLRAEAAYHARKIARRPALPRKILAALCAGFGTLLASIGHEAGMFSALGFGIAASGLHLAAFGIDPLQNKRLEGIDEFQQDRVARVVRDAEAHLTAMAEHIETLKDRKLDLRVAQFHQTAEEMIRTVEEDPRDLTAARKFLGVYLMGARDAAAKYAQLANRAPDPEARDKFEALLDDLEGNFAAKTQKMMHDDRSDLEIEIKVLRDRLQREGVRLD